jgi:hypothetical protein
VTCCIALADLLVDEEHFDEFNTSGEMAWIIRKYS